MNVERHYSPSLSADKTQEFEPSAPVQEKSIKLATSDIELVTNLMNGESINQLLTPSTNMVAGALRGMIGHKIDTWITRLARHNITHFESPLRTTSIPPSADILHIPAMGQAEKLIISDLYDKHIAPVGRIHLSDIPELSYILFEDYQRHLTFCDGSVWSGQDTKDLWFAAPQQALAAGIATTYFDRFRSITYTEDIRVKVAYPLEIDLRVGTETYSEIPAALMVSEGPYRAKIDTRADNLIVGSNGNRIIIDTKFGKSRPAAQRAIYTLAYSQINLNRDYAISAKDYLNPKHLTLFYYKTFENGEIIYENATPTHAEIDSTMTSIRGIIPFACDHKEEIKKLKLIKNEAVVYPFIM